MADRVGLESGIRETTITTGGRTTPPFVHSNSDVQVTLITQSFPPETHAGANRAIAMAMSLSTECQLTVIAPMPSHPTPDRFQQANVEAHDRQLSFRIKRSSNFHPHTSGYLRRGLREMALAVSLARKVARSTDIVVATTPSFFIAPAAQVASRLVRSRFHWDIRDLTWEYALDALQHLPERQRLRRAGSHMMRSMARWVSRGAHGVIASNAGIANYFETTFGCNVVSVSRNGVSQGVYTDLGNLRSRPSPSRNFRVTYVGALGYFQALETMLDAAEKIPDVEFRIVGDGPERNRLGQAVEDRQLGNVTFTGFLERDRVYDEYANADILFAQLRGTDVMGSSTVPSKIYEYLAAGRPIVYGGAGITAEFLSNTGAARVVAPEDMVGLVDAVRDLRDDPELRSRMSDAGRAAARTRIREDSMAEAVCQILSHTHGPDHPHLKVPDLATDSVPDLAG